jgi:hypothetical protein
MPSDRPQNYTTLTDVTQGDLMAAALNTARAMAGLRARDSWQRSSAAVLQALA